MEVHKTFKKHRLACSFFNFRHFWLFLFPQAILTMASSIFAFLKATRSDDCDDTLVRLVEEEDCYYYYYSQTKRFATAAGCTSAIVLFLQAMSAYCGYNLRASMHDGTAMDLRDLNDDLITLLQVVLPQSKLLLVATRTTETLERKAEEATDNNTDNNKRPLSPKSNFNDSNNKEDNNFNTFEYLQSRYQHALKGCKSEVPIEISKAFLDVDSAIATMMISRTTRDNNNRVVAYLARESNGMLFENKYDQTYYYLRDITSFKSYDMLASNIVSSRFYWPMFIPGPKAMAEMTINDVQSDLIKMESITLEEEED